jgi:hypothetical protein
MHVLVRNKKFFLTHSTFLFAASRESRKSSGATSVASSVSPRNPVVANLVADASSRLKKHAQKHNLRLQIPGLNRLLKIIDNYI